MPWWWMEGWWCGCCGCKTPVRQRLLCASGCASCGVVGVWLGGWVQLRKVRFLWLVVAWSVLLCGMEAVCEGGSGESGPTSAKASSYRRSQSTDSSGSTCRRCRPDTFTTRPRCDSQQLIASKPISTAGPCHLLLQLALVVAAPR